MMRSARAIGQLVMAAAVGVLVVRQVRLERRMLEWIGAHDRAVVLALNEQTRVLQRFINQVWRTVAGGNP